MSKINKILATIIILAIMCSNYSYAAFAATAEDQNQSTTQGEATSGTDTNAVDTALSEIPADKVAEENVNNKNVTAPKSSEKKADTKKDEAKKTSTKSSCNKKASYSKSDLRLLSCLIYSEAGNQTYTTMLGVGNVVLNRVDSKAYWHIDTIKEVIYDRKWSIQFSVTIKNRKTGISPYEKALKTYDSGKYNASMKKSIKAAKAALSGDNNIGSYLCFSNKNYKTYVKKHYSKYRIIDDMIFYRTK